MQPFFKKELMQPIRQAHQRTFMELEASTLECVGPRDASDANGAGTISVMNVWP